MNNPNRSFYVREITRKIGEQINSVRRELSNMLSIGIISSDTEENRLYYEVNQKYSHYQALRSIFASEGTVKVGTKPEDHSIAGRVRALGAIDLAILTGGFSRDNSVGVDLVIVGDVNKTKLKNFIEEIEKEENREINYAAMPLKEYRYRKDVRDRFLDDIFQAKKTVLVDTHGEMGDKTE